MTSPTALTIKEDDYSVHYDLDSHTVVFAGELQLSGMDDYASIMTLLDDVVQQEPATLTLDLRQLEFLNSSGINMLLRLVIKVREKTGMQLIVKGSDRISWQSRSLQNLKRLMPALELQIE